MANSDRHYEPTIDLQGFDLTMNMDAVHEPSRLPLVVMIALVVLAAFAGVVWLAYTQGVERGRESVSRELTAQQFLNLRKPPATAYTGLKIYEPPATDQQASNRKSSPPAKPRVANTVPTLRPAATAASEGPAPADAANSVAPAAAFPTTADGSPALPEPNKKTAAAPALATKSAQRVATRAPTQLTKPETAPTTTHPLTEPDSLAPAPAATPSAPPARKPAVATPPASVSAPAAATTHAATGGIMLQIGSYKSDAEARTSWQAFKSEHDAAAAYQPDVRQVDLGAKGTWYRLRMGPFPDKSSALDTCRKLKADGASCLLAQ